MTQERNSQPEPHNSLQSDNKSIVHTGSQGSEEEQGQKTLYRQPDGRSRNSLSLQYERTVLITKKLAGKYCRPNRLVKDRQGQTITDSEQRLEIRVEHFEELFNRSAPEKPSNMTEADIYIEINCDPPTRDKIISTLKKVRNGKAASPDGIPAEALKTDVETTADMLLPLFKNIWEQEEIPRDWKDGQIIKLQKKRDLSSCENYRGITLLSASGKVFNRILLERMRDAVDVRLQHFRQDTSCTDQIATLRSIVEQSWSGIPSSTSTSWTSVRLLTIYTVNHVAAPLTIRDSSQTDTNHQGVVKEDGSSCRS
jgi:hypothetical protein